MNKTIVNDCVFCRIAKKEIPCKEIYRDDKTLAFLDIDPVSIGHALVIPTEHAEGIDELSESAAGYLGKTIRKVAAAMRKSLGCDFNILNNRGKHAGQAVHHVHFHIIPRRGYLEEFSFQWKPVSYDKAVDQEILAAIKGKL